MSFESISGSIILKYSFNMKRPRLKALMVTIMAHVLVVTLKGDPAISTRFLYDSDCQERECADDEYTDPCTISS